MSRVLDLLKTFWLWLLFMTPPPDAISDEEEDDAEDLGRMW